MFTSVVQILEQDATHVGVATDHMIESFRRDLRKGVRRHSESVGTSNASSARSGFQAVTPQTSTCPLPLPSGRASGEAGKVWREAEWART